KQLALKANRNNRIHEERARYSTWGKQANQTTTYTKTEVDTALALKSHKTYVDTQLALKPNQ
ncbi:MAG: hypothetical protein ACKPKO_46260, partial [Candidatus Fonsibacter sp.]